MPGYCGHSYDKLAPVLADSPVLYVCLQGVAQSALELRERIQITLKGCKRMIATSKKPVVAKPECKLRNRENRR